MKFMSETENKFRQRDQSLEEIAARLGVRAERGRRFAELTSLRVGGAIDWVVSPVSEAQAAAVVHAMDQAGVAWRALGSGSNILADDGDHRYVVLSLKELKGELEFDGERVDVTVGAHAALEDHLRLAGAWRFRSASGSPLFLNGAALLDLDRILRMGRISCCVGLLEDCEDVLATPLSVPCVEPEVRAAAGGSFRRASHDILPCRV